MNLNKLSTFVRFLQSGIVKPPIQISGLEGKYAHALYSAASKKNSLEKVEKEMKTILEAFEKDVKLRELVQDPTISNKFKIEAMKSVSSKLSLGSETANLLTLLAENGRMKKFMKIAGAFNQIMSAHRGELSCEVTTAEPLEEGKKAELLELLKSFRKGEEVVKLNTKVDPGIIGGIVLSIGDHYVDLSIASKIEKLTQVMKNT